MCSLSTRIAQFCGIRQLTRNLLQVDNTHMLTQTCNYAARRGTRERKLKYLRKMKARAETRKALLLPLKSKKKLKQGGKTSDLISDAQKPLAEDDVFFANLFKIKEFTFNEAVAAHREANHPTIYNSPDSPLNAFIELDMSLDKKTKFHGSFTGLVSVDHPFKHNEDRSILVFCKTIDQINEVTDAGATLAGGAEIIKAIKKGKITLPDFQFIIAHPNVAIEMMAIRGLLKRNLPTIENGMLTTDLLGMIEKIKIGVRYQASRDEIEPSYGWINVKIGYLNMELEHLEDNFVQILQHVKSQAPKRAKEAPFITRCFLTSPTTEEKLKLSFEHYIADDEPEQDTESDDEDQQLKQSSMRGKK